jgi:hypothetical protein
MPGVIAFTNDGSLAVGVLDLERRSVAAILRPLKMLDGKTAPESAFLVALITALSRPSLSLAPALLIGAPQLSGSGTGKGHIGELKACICGAVFVTCIESSLPRLAAFGSPHPGSSRRVMWPRLNFGELP